jgi:cytochrome c-type biogenesis protein CcmH
VRTSIVSIATLFVLVAAIVVVLMKSLAPPEAPPSSASGTAASSDGPSISGSVTITPDLAGRVQATAVLFVIARKTSGPPFAVKRIAPPRLPTTYRLGPEDVMMAGESFDGDIQVSVRVSQTGTAGPPQPGDLEGEHAAPVRIGARNVDLVIARAR